MYDEKLVKKFVATFQKLRRLQARRLKLQLAAQNKPDPKNVKPMQAMLAQIKGLFEELEKMAAELAEQGKLI